MARSGFGLSFSSAIRSSYNSPVIPSRGAQKLLLVVQCISFALLLGFGSFAAVAQTTNNASSWAGITGASLPVPYEGAPEQINLSNGNLNVTIPLLSLPGRDGQNLTLSAQTDSLTYHIYSLTTAYSTSFSWINNQPWQQWGIAYVVDTSDLAGFYPVQGCQEECPNPQPVYCDHFAVVMADGTWLTFDNVENCVQGSEAYPLPLSHVNVVTQSAMEFAKLDTTHPNDIVFTSRDGNQIHFAAGSAYKLSDACALSCEYPFSRMVDPNGNTITLTTSLQNYQTTYTFEDNMGRTVTVGPTSVTYPDSNSSSGTAQITISSSSISGPSVSIAATNCGQTPFQSPSLGGSGLILHTYTFPSGSKFQETTDALGFVNSVIYPTGGYKRFWYDTFQVQNVSGCQSVDTREVTHKFECSSGSCGCSMTSSNQACSGETETTYSPTTFGGVFGNSQNILKAFAGAATSAPLLKEEVHSFAELQNLSSGPPVVRETNLQTIDSSGNVKRTLSTVYKSSNVWDFGWVPQTVTITYPVTQNSSVATTTTYTYPYFSITDPNYPGTTIYFDKPSKVSTTDFTGTNLQTTSTTYAWQGNSGYLSNEMLDLVTSQEVDDGGGVKNAYTLFGYDEYSLQPSGVTTQHGAGVSPPGNQTSVHRWLNGTTTATTNCSITIGNGYAVSYKTYFDTGMPYQSTDDCGTKAGDVSHTTTYSYASAYAGAYPTTITNPLSQAVTFAYDFNSGFMTSASDPNNQQITKTYDIMSRLTQVSYPDGGSSTFCYSDMGGATCSQASPPLEIVTTKAITSSLNETSTIIFDGFGRLSQTQLNSDTPSTTYTLTQYDALGRKAAVYNPTRCSSITTNCGESTWGYMTYTYDPLDRVTAVSEQDGSSVSTSYSGNCSTVTDETSKSRKSCTDALGRLTGVWEDPDGVNYETDYQYNALGNLTKVTQNGNSGGNARIRTFQYDSLSRLASTLNPESGTIGYAYDANGNLVTKTALSPNQGPTGTATIVTTLSYDVLNRLTGKSYSDAYKANPTTAGALYSYDGLALAGCKTTPPGLTDGYPIGRRTSMCDASGGTSWAHDQMGRITQERRTIGGVKGDYDTDVYNLDGSIKSVTTLGYGVSYTYNGAARPITAKNTSDPFNYVTSASYAPFGGLTAMAMGVAPINVSNSYNSRMQPSTLSASTTAATIMSLSYDFHMSTKADNGDVFQIVNNRDGNRTQNFTYDSLDRLQSAYTAGSNWGENYTIDPWSNLTNIALYSGKKQSEQLNCASASTNNQLTNCYNYDAAGNLITNATGNYAYDAEGRLNSTAGMSYIYDGDGKRVEKCTAGSTTGTCATNPSGTLYWSGWTSNPVVETDLAGNILENYVFFNGIRIARRDASTKAVHFYFSDHLGTLSLITDATGDMPPQTESDYYPFGGEIPLSGNDTNHYKFTGKERDIESGLDNFGARYNASTMGRFMTPDPRNFAAHRLNPQSWNAYSYALNRPLTLIDPNGLEPVKAQAGTIHGFAQNMNNTPHHVGQSTGTAAATALQSLGATEGFSPKNTAVFNMSANRYVYTANGGWVDMVHFVFYAGRAATNTAEGNSNPVAGAVQDGFHQELMDTFKAPWSAYSYEDLPSDRLGAIFGAQYFDPTSPLTLAEQMELFFELYLVPMPATSAPNFANIPMQDSRNPPTATNHTTNPMYTYRWISSASTQRACVTAAGETTCE